MYGEEASKLAREAKRTIDHFPPYNDTLVRSVIREIRHLHETCQELEEEFRLQKQQVESEVERRWHEQHGTVASGSASLAAAQGTSQQGTLSFDTSDSSTTVAMLDEVAPPSVPSSLGTAHSFSGMGLHSRKQAAIRLITQEFWTKYLVYMTPLQRNKRILMAYHHQRLEKIKEFAWVFNAIPEGSRRLLSPDEIIFFNEYEKQCRNKYSNLSEFGEIDLGLGMISPPKEVFITVRVLKDCGDIVTESGATLSLKKNSEHFVKRGDVERLINQGYLLHVA
ncbi:DNA replication protein psf1 [Mortierella sp. NVP85]|nr:DNA replication protein psf1 [Mortierella sp. NVP85]